MLGFSISSASVHLQGALYNILSDVGTVVLVLLPGISTLLISTLPVHSPAIFPKPLPNFSCVGIG